MAVKLPPTGGSNPPRPSSGGRHRHRSHAPRVGGVGHHEQHEGPEVAEALPLAGMQLAAKVQRLNQLSTGSWSTDDYRELERLCEQLVSIAERLARQEAPDNPHATDMAVNAAKHQVRMMLQSLQPPEELLEEFLALWTRFRSSGPFELSTFARKSLMSSKVRADVMNRQMEEAVDEADRLATQRRVEAIDADAGGGGGKGEGDAEPQQGPPPKSVTLKHTLRLLKKKRRDLSRDDAEDAAQKTLETMRTLRDQVAPRWAPEAQPWLVNTADNHVYQTVLAVIPAELFRETNAYDGIQNLRAGELAFSHRAEDKLGEAASKSRL